MVRRIVRYPFDQFDRNALRKDEKEVLDGGMVKHVSALRAVAAFALPQVALAAIAPEIFILLSAVSFVSMMLGSAWYTISFQNVSEAQLIAGVADFITKKMFRAFMLSFDTLIICALAFVVKMLLPEMRIPEIADIPLWLRVVILALNLAWLVLVLADVYFASVAYDAADSLLGDGFPTLMRGARASHTNSPLVKLLAELSEKLGVDPEKIQAIVIAPPEDGPGAKSED